MSEHTQGLRLSSVQRFALKQVLLGWNQIFERRFTRTLMALYRKGLLDSPHGKLTGLGQLEAKKALQEEVDRRAAIAQAENKLLNTEAQRAAEGGPTGAQS